MLSALLASPTRLMLPLGDDPLSWPRRGAQYVRCERLQHKRYAQLCRSRPGHSPLHAQVPTGLALRASKVTGVTGLEDDRKGLHSQYAPACTAGGGST